MNNLSKNFIVAILLLSVAFLFINCNDNQPYVEHFEGLNSSNFYLKYPDSISRKIAYTKGNLICNPDSFRIPVNFKLYNFVIDSILAKDKNNTPFKFINQGKLTTDTLISITQYSGILKFNNGSKKLVGGQQFKIYYSMITIDGKKTFLKYPIKFTIIP